MTQLPNRNETTMIIDDSVTDQFMTTKILQKARFLKDPLIYTFANKALIFLKENSSNFAKLPQIILLDLNMPEMSGFEFIEEYDKLPEKLKKHCKVYMISATINDDEISSAGTYKNISGFHSKPLTVAFVNGI